MKILQVIPFFSPEFGGSVTSTFLTCQKLSERGHNVTILTTDFHFDSFYAQKLKNVEVIPIECLFHIGLFFYSPKMKAWLSENISKYDIIHLQNFRSYQNAIVSFYSKKHQIPYILQARGSVLPFFEKQLLKLIFDMIWGNKILKNASKCIALTKTESDQYIKMGVPEDKIVIIPNGIDISRYANLPPRGQFRLKYKIPVNERIILFLGRIHKIKGIDILVESFSIICNNKSNVKLVIAGPDSGDLAQIKKSIHEFQIENSVILPGPLYSMEKIEAYVDADVFVLPSRYETFPNSVLEAWACGTSVIATINCQISEYVKEAGYLIEENPAELGNTIRKVFSDNAESERQIKQKNGKHLVQNVLNIDNTISQVESLYRDKLLESRNEMIS